MLALPTNACRQKGPKVIRLSPRSRFLALYFAAIGVWLATTAMHIPDGYLSPISSLVMFALVLPFWVIGVRKLRSSMHTRSVPLIALMAAFSFIVMMFNVPLPGGTTAHAVGATLAAVLLGPETATIAVSIALVIQALFFGDGGILALGANSFNMAVVLPYIAAALYRAVSKGTLPTSRRRLIGAAIGGWVGLSTAAFFAGIEFGLQPLLFTAPNGTPLYAPYPLSIAIPAMVIPHALTASIVEGLLTALILAYLQRSNLALIEGGEGRLQAGPIASWRDLRWLWIGIFVLIVASPLGLLAPGTAWGEWGTVQLRERGLATIPAGLEQLSTLWGAPLAGYRLKSLGNASLGYILSAAVGILVIGLLAWLFSFLVGRAPEDPDRSD